MKAAKSATASVKETVQNVKARAEQKSESDKASAVFKADKKNAANKAEKHEAIAKKHAAEAAIIHEYEQKKADHAAQKEQKKAVIYQKKGDKHAETGADLNNTTGGDEAPAVAAPSYNPASTTGQENLTNQDVTTGPPGPVPIHGSGVPTHSTLHNHDQNHDVGVTPNMGPSANTGSYM